KPIPCRLRKSSIGSSNGCTKSTFHLKGDDDALLHRNDDLGYPIIVAPDVRSHVREFIAQKNIHRCIVLSDAQPDVVRVARRVTNGIPGKLALIPIQLGEKRKRLETVEHVLEKLLARGADRTTFVFGVGGGVASDLFGFASAIFMRGIPYAHIATSLVAMVD